MTTLQIIALCFLPVLLFIMAGVNRNHVKETGVPMPSRKAMARIRRNARQKGISENEAYDQWVANKQKRLPKGRKSATALPNTRDTPSYNQSDPTDRKTGSWRSFETAFPRVPEPLAIKVTEVRWPEEGSSTFEFVFGFSCMACGATDLDREEEPSQRTTCKACGAYLGEFSEIRACCEKLGRAELQARGLSPKA